MKQKFSIHVAQTCFGSVNAKDGKICEIDGLNVDVSVGNLGKSSKDYRACETCGVLSAVPAHAAGISSL